MPHFIPLIWTAKSLHIQIKPTGIRKFLPMLPYFSGTLFEFSLLIKNSSNKKKKWTYCWILQRHTDESRIAPEVVAMDYVDYSIDGNKRGKLKISTLHIPKPGNYSLELHVTASNKGFISGEVAYFDVLPRDATIVNWLYIIISAIISCCIGLILGFIIS